MREPYAVGSFRCKDGYVSFLPLGSRMWPQLARMIDRPDLINDPRFATPDDRTERREELETVFQAWFDDHTRMQVFAAGQRENACPAPQSWKPTNPSKTRTSASARTSSTSCTPTPAH